MYEYNNLIPKDKVKKAFGFTFLQLFKYKYKKIEYYRCIIQKFMEQYGVLF